MNTSGPQSLDQGRGWRFWALRGAFEGALIIMSVVLGMALSQWAQDQRDAARVCEMRSFIVQEMQRNRELIASDLYLPHHTRLLKTVREVMAMDKITMAEADIAFGAITKTGIHFAPLDDSVWRSVSSGDLLEHMAPEEVFAIARVYSSQGGVAMVNQNFYAQISRLPVDMAGGMPPSGAIGMLNLSLADLVGSEEALIKRYDSALALLQGRPEIPPEAPKMP